MVSQVFKLAVDEVVGQVQSKVKEIFQGQEYVDVTLMCDDQKVFRAHKVVLSVFSPVFQSMLQAYNHPHPLIVMRGLSSEDLGNVLKFIYNGEVTIEQNELKSFIELAEDFQIIGVKAKKLERFKKCRKTLRDDVFLAVNITENGPSLTSTPRKVDEDEIVLVDNEALDELNGNIHGERAKSVGYLLEGQFNCEYCNFKAVSELALQQHRFSKHSLRI